MHTAQMEPLLAKLCSYGHNHASTRTGGVAGSRKLPVMPALRYAPFGGPQSSFSSHLVSPREGGSKEGGRRRRAQSEQGAKRGGPVPKPAHRTPSCGLPSGITPSCAGFGSTVINAAQCEWRPVARPMGQVRTSRRMPGRNSLISLTVPLHKLLQGVWCGLMWDHLRRR